jgi:hypothetical protein
MVKPPSTVMTCPVRYEASGASQEVHYSSDLLGLRRPPERQVVTVDVVLPEPISL